MKLPNNVNSTEELDNYVSIGKRKKFNSLVEFLNCFNYICPSITGYIDSIKRIAYEFVED